MMYQFPEDLKKAYESSAISFVFYQNIDDRAVPVLVSDGFCRNTGMSREKVMNWLNIGLFERMHPNDVGVMVQISDDFLHHRGSYDVVFRCRLSPVDSKSQVETSDERYAQIHGLGKWQTMPDGTELVVISYANLSKTREITRESLEMYSLRQGDYFYTDPLTGLPNINYLNKFGEEKVNAVRADGKTPYVVYSDIDSMQSYNNQYGVKGGDRLLCLTAETLQNLFPKALVARGADDHFIMISALNDPKEIEKRLGEANRIIRDQAEGNTFGFRSGVCPVERGTTLNLALDHAKHAIRLIETDMTREVEFFSQAVDDKYWQRRYIVENFDKAMEAGWIRVFYHAIYRIENRKIAAFEGLSRWVDPGHGVIPPGDFIPVLRKYHQLYKLDLYMFEQVCREAKRRYEDGLPLVPVSVNFSQQDFDHVDVVAEMNRIYDKCQMEGCVDKELFIVEVTEQDLAVGTDMLQEQLEQIRKSGYGLWLDDFGSGYSALNVFSRFDFDMIKCDLELLKHLDDHGGINRLILKELVDVARQIGVHVLIEGLETEDHLSFVREIGCEMAQGFYYHEPEPLDLIAARLKTDDADKLCETPSERDEMNRKWLQ